MAITPRRPSSTERFAILFRAPRTLNDPVRWKSSHLSRAPSVRDDRVGVRGRREAIVSRARRTSSLTTTALIVRAARAADAGVSDKTRTSLSTNARGALRRRARGGRRRTSSARGTARGRHREAEEALGRTVAGRSLAHGLEEQHGGGGTRVQRVRRRPVHGDRDVNVGGRGPAPVEADVLGADGDRHPTSAVTSSSVASTTGSVKTAPVEARIAFGFHGSAAASATTSASAPAASAERVIAPRLPGFSIPTATR